jgi:hypothetical protein
MMDMFAQQGFDMDHLVPWLKTVVVALNEKP